MGWTQPLCDKCFVIRVPDRKPFKMKPEFAELERCCDCGEETTSGIYFRIDPRFQQHPRT